jgi:predicted MPP superfamily phosphohydrolase
MPSLRVRSLILVTFTAALAVVLAYGFFIEPRRLVINAQELPVQGLDPAFDGLKIAAIGDIHGGTNYVTEERLREIVRLTNEQHPDLIVLLGDYVGHDPGISRITMPMRTVAEGLAGFQAPYGVFAVLGNHDGWYGDSTVAAELRRVGIKVLQNEVASLDINGKPLRILGLKDHMELAPRWYKMSADVKQILEGSDGQIIVLEHSPDVVPQLTGDELISPDLKLVLAAHTHGGQVWLPLIGSPIVPSSYGQKYRAGHIRDRDVDIFVTTGIGTSMLPFRFLVPPEIAILTLREER